VLTGAVLVGGKSRRFGTNKALETFEGRRLIDRSLDALGPWCEPLVVVGNELIPYIDTDTDLVRDFIPEQGPLGGIYTALLFSPHDWVLVKATDMPFLEPELIRAMLERREGADAVVPVTGPDWEPLLALYHRNCIPHIASTLEENRRRVAAVYRRVRVRVFAEEEWRKLDPEGTSFLNINTPADWERLQWI
jgi:molybdopterin-guanine dinucleotide biosynthesis protein A